MEVGGVCGGLGSACLLAQIGADELAGSNFKGGAGAERSRGTGTGSGDGTKLCCSETRPKTNRISLSRFQCPSMSVAIYEYELSVGSMVGWQGAEGSNANTK